MNETNQYNTDFLFSTSNYLSGAATAFNLFGNFYEYNFSPTDNEADHKAISNDFDIIGNDLLRAITDQK